MKFPSVIRRHKRSGPGIAVLVDPDKYNPEVIRLAHSQKVDCLLVGGSVLENGDVGKTVRAIKKITSLPVVLFPGDESQLTPEADGLLLLSLLSGRNPDYLIEKHISAAPLIRKMKLRFLSTAYLLVGKGNQSSTRIITKTEPLDPSQETYIVNTALAASQLGFQAIYLEAGSGAGKPVSARLIRKIKKNVSLPLIVGGGLDTKAKIRTALMAGADLLVVGNALEKTPALLVDLCLAFREAAKT